VISFSEKKFFDAAFSLTNQVLTQPMDMQDRNMLMMRIDGEVKAKEHNIYAATTQRIPDGT